MALTGLAAGPINPIIGVISYNRIPAHMRARVLGFLSAGVLIAMPLGALIAGFLLEFIRLRWMLVLYGVIYLVATGSLLFNPTTTEIDAPPIEPDAVVEAST